MTALPQAASPQGIHGVSVVDTSADLDVFAQPHCAASIWQRQLPPDVHDWLDGLDDALLPRGRTVVPCHEVEATVQRMCDQGGTPPGAEQDWLVSDVCKLSDLFASLMAVRTLRLRLDVISNNACRKFHVDAITGRLVCTYRGSGTQYGHSNGGADPDTVFAVQSGSPVLLRGTLWPETPASGLLHRSPPIEGTGETRLLLVLDPAEPEDTDL